MALPNCGLIKTTILENLKAGKEYTVKEITEIVSSTLNLTDEEVQERTLTGSNKLHTRVSVQISNMVKAGRLIKEGKVVRLA